MQNTNTKLYKITQVIWYIFYFIEAVLLLRFILRLIGANPVDFTNIIYSISYPFVAPFLYIVGSPSLGEATLEWSTLIAMLVYWFIAWGVVRLILLTKPVSETEATQGLSEQEK